MPILLIDLLKESPDEVQLKNPPHKIRWWEGGAKSFICFPEYSLVRTSGTHGSILSTVHDAGNPIRLYNNMKISKLVANLSIKKKFDNMDVTCSDIDAFVKDFTDGRLAKFMEKHGDEWYIYNMEDFRKVSKWLSGRIWPDGKIISFWNELSDVKDNWRQVKKMFETNDETKYKLEDFQIDYLDRDVNFFTRGVLPDLVSAEYIDSGEESHLSPDDIRNLQKRLHTLPPDEKKRAMAKLGMINVGKAKDVKANYYQDAIAEGMIRLKDLLLEAVTENPNFKKWFGNSKVVDDQKKPLVVYHGTNQPIDKFDPIRRGASTANSNSRRGFFFTSDKQESSDYADLAASKVIANVEDHEKKTAKLLQQIEQAERVRNFGLADKLTVELETHEIGATREGEIGANVLPVYLSIQNPKIVNTGGGFNVGQVSDAISAAEKEGKDGVILLGIEDSPKGNIKSTHYIVFNPTQVKSALANNGDFNPKSPYLTK